MLFLFCFCFYRLFEDKATILFHCVGAGWNFFSPWHSRVGVVWRFTRILQEKNEQNLSFGPTVHFCDFVWNYLSCLLGCAEGKTATVRLRQCKTIPNSKLQTSCYKDRFMGVPLMNFMPFGGSPERLVIDHHPERFLEIVRKKKNVFLNTRAWSYIITPSSHSPNSFGLKPNSRLLIMRLFSGWHFVSQLIYLPQMFCF